MVNVMVILCVFTCEAKGQLVITIFSKISAPLINESLNVKHIGFCMIFDARKKICLYAAFRSYLFLKSVFIFIEIQWSLNLSTTICFYEFKKDTVNT